MSKSSRIPVRLPIVIALLPLLACLLTSPLAAAEIIIQTNGVVFTPDTVTIEVGDTVTWINSDNGFHNVVADDGSFTSGAPSTDAWTYSVVFLDEGSWTYFCEVHLGAGMTGTIIVEGVFADNLETGDTDRWSSVTGGIRNCDCYFSSDCAANQFCYYGPGGFAEEDICLWRNEKPNGTPGAGCSSRYIGDWIPDICDGVCTDSRLGSLVGRENTALLTSAVELWAEAILQPAEAGGGVVDATLAQAAQAIGFEHPATAENLGRETASLLTLSGTPSFYKHFCHWEAYPEDPNPELWVDLSAEPCRAANARLFIEALRAEVAAPGTAGRILNALDLTCGELKQTLLPGCSGGDLRQCAVERVTSTANFLLTPRDLEGHIDSVFGENLRRLRRLP